MMPVARDVLCCAIAVLALLACVSALLARPAHADERGLEALGVVVGDSVCAGDCGGTGQVTVEGIVLLVNIASGELESACEQGIPPETAVTTELIVTAVANALSGCPGAPGIPTATPTPTATQAGTETPTPPSTPPTPDTPPIHFCDLPGAVVSTDSGKVIVPGGSDTQKLAFLQLPAGFCAHYFAKINNARQMRFAPGGELFVASPTTISTGGGLLGKASIIALADENGDGSADVSSTFMSGLPSTQGMMFANGYFYYQDATRIMRMPYTPGQRVSMGPGEQIADITYYISILHWPKPIDIADDGTIYVGNGGDQGEPCINPHPFHGGVLKLGETMGGTPVTRGFRNPISLRCARGHNRCFALELARDFTALQGGREKLVPIRDGDDWGYPCCATRDLPFPDIVPRPDCGSVHAEDGAFYIGETPFDLDFETGKWPAPWNDRVYVPLHGAYGSWEGARVVGIEMNPQTGEVLPGSDLSGESSGAMKDFATGWDDRTLSHGRPAAVVFAPDGRLFLANDNNGDIIWIAPVDLSPQP